MPSVAGPVPQPLADTNALFESLLEFRWREVSFPTTSFEVELRQDLEIHKFVDRDGAHIEGTGRAPLEISARIPFINGLLAGANEHWQRPLYPFTWRKFFAAMGDRSSGTLQHPELGDLTCKPQRCRVTWAADRRGGVDVEASWIESDDTADDVTEALAAASPLADLDAAAGDLDTQLATTLPAGLPALPTIAPPGFPAVPNIPSAPTFPTSFEDFMSSILATVDQFTLLQKRTAGKLDNIAYQAQSLEDHLSLAANQNALNWPIVQAAERVKAGVIDVKQTLLARAKTIGLYTVTVPATLAALSVRIPAPVTDLITLNKTLLANPIVPVGAQVRFYAKSA